MELFDLSLPRGHRLRFASCFVSDKVAWASADEVCERCYLPNHRRRLAPYTVSWEPGSSVIPDFVSSYNDLIVSERVVSAFKLAELTGYERWPLKIKDAPNRAKSEFPIVPSPYPGPPLWDLYVDIDQIVRLLPEESTVQFIGNCEKCGAEQWRIPDDIELKDQYYVVDRKTWHGQDFMLPFEINSMFVTERVVNIIKSGEFTNIEIRKIGRLSD